MIRELYRGLQWRDDQTRKMFEPVVASARNAWDEIEIASVPGERTSALIYLDPPELPTATRDAVKYGLSVVPVFFDSARRKLRCVVTSLPPKTWVDAVHAEDDRLVGQMLGYPSCCVETFERVWVAENRHDVVAEYAGLEGLWQSNSLLRRLGIRMTPWMPCSATCAATLTAALRYEALARENDIDVDSIARVLDLALTYDSRNGIAIIDTPLFRLSCDADLGIIKMKRPGIQAPLLVAPPFVDNGFGTHSDMREAHSFLLAAIGPSPGSVLDLGAGDGTLLSKIPGGGGKIGIELRADVALRGRLRHRDVTLRIGRIQDTASWPGTFDTVLLSVNRLLEMTVEDAANVRANLRTARRVVGYAYADNVRVHGSLVELVKKAGLRQASEVAVSPRGQVLEVTT